MIPSADTILTFAPLIAALVTVLMGGEAWADSPAPLDDRGKTIAAARVSVAPVLDGRLDDEAWRGVVPDSRLTQQFPDEGQAPSERTDVYLAYDDRALYVAVRCHDRHAERIATQLTRRDRDTNADKVTVDIDSRGDHLSAYHFDVNVSGVMADGLRFNDVDYNGDWDGLWDAVTTRDAGGWTAEIEIPWRTLRFAGGEPEMGLQIQRLLPRRQEVDQWSFIPREARAQVSRYGHLVGVRGLGPKRLITVAPYVATAAVVRSNAGPDDGTTVTPNAGLDLKVGLTSSLTLDATLNPDFGQIEADQVVLNLTTFEVFYPEKRPFFLEGVDLFSAPVKQFYTRRIGRAPPALVDADTVVDAPIGGRIWGAAKLSGQIVPHLSIAVLDAITAEREVVVQHPGVTTPERRVVDPLANFAVVRLRSDWGNSYVGAMGTAVTRVERPYSATPDPLGQLCPGDGDLQRLGRCTHDAYTASVDTRLVTRDANWGVAAQALMSRVDKGPPRTLPDGTTVGTGDSGVGMFLEAGKQGGEHVLAGVRYQGYSPKLELNDAGYLKQANVHQFGANLVVRSTKPVGPTLESSFELYVQGALTWSGLYQSSGAAADLWMRFHNFWQLYVEVGYKPTSYDNRETGYRPAGTDYNNLPDGALTERSAGWWFDLWGRTDPRRAVVVELGLHANRVQHGLATNGSLKLSVRPVSQLELELIPRFNYAWGEPRYAFRTDFLVDGSRRYWFGDLTSQSFDVTLRGIYTFTPRLTLQVYGQMFIAGAHYDDFVTSTVAPGAACAAGETPCPFGTLRLPSFVAAPSLGSSQDLQWGTVNLNVVLRWEYLPGSTLIAVYSRSQVQQGYDPTMQVGVPSLAAFRGATTEDQAMVKLSYLWH